MFRRKYRQGDPVIFAKDKRSTHPGPRAHEVHPAPWGESYLYKVDKFWRVLADECDGKVTLVTRRGRPHVVSVNDPRLRHASIWHRLRYRGRFPNLSILSDPSQGQTTA